MIGKDFFSEFPKSLRKFLGISAFCVTVLPTSAFAHGQLWYDVKSHVPQFKKIVIYPLVWTDGTFLVDPDEKSVIYKSNDYLDKRFVRKLKFRTISLGRTLQENKDLRTDEEKYRSLYNTYPNETERGKAVFDVTGSDGYLVPHILECRPETYTSPETRVTVPMRSWTEVKNSPRGNYTTNERSWNESHVIPARSMTLYHMEVEHTMYDRDGQKVLLYENSQHSYDYKSSNYAEKMFKDLVDEFRKDVKDIQDNFKEETSKGRTGPRIGFREIRVPDSVGNRESFIKSVYFGMKDGVRRWTDGRSNFSPEDSPYEKYYVTGNISQYSLDRRWIAPHVTTWDSVVSHREEKWYDRNGGEHKMQITDYRTDITDHYGIYAYTATVSGTFQLVDANTGRPVVSHSATETDDKTADAYLHFMKDFYGKVAKYIHP